MGRSLGFSTLSVLLISCAGGDELNSDASEQQLCSAVTGEWKLSETTCEGVAQESPSLRLLFNPTEETVVQTLGTPQCAASFSSSATFGTDASMQFAGQGNFACAVSGVDAPTCSGEETDCSNATLADTQTGDFSQCVFNNQTSVVVRRTVSSDDIAAGRAQCALGENEVMTFTPYTSASKAYLVISDGPTFSFGSPVVGATLNNTFTITNFGTESATALAASPMTAPFSFRGGAYPGTSGDCGLTLAASSSCSVEVAYGPTIVGTFGGNIELSYNDGGGVTTLSRTLTGSATGGTAVLVISESDPYSYGTLAVGGESTKIFTVTNSGNGPGTGISGGGLAAPFHFHGGSYPGSGGSCGSTLAAAASCQVVVAFSPVATGLVADTILMNFNDGGAAQVAQRDLQGTGASPALLEISEAPLFDYGTVGAGMSSSHTFTVTNSGGTTASAMTEVGLSDPFAFSGGSYPGTGGTCGSTLVFGATCDIVVDYSPGMFPSNMDTIEISYSDGATSQIAERDIQGSSF